MTDTTKPNPVAYLQSLTPDQILYLFQDIFDYKTLPLPLRRRYEYPLEMVQWLAQITENDRDLGRLLRQRFFDFYLNEYRSLNESNQELVYDLIQGLSTIKTETNIDKLFLHLKDTKLLGYKVRGVLLKVKLLAILSSLNDSSIETEIKEYLLKECTQADYYVPQYHIVAARYFSKKRDIDGFLEYIAKSLTISLSDGKETQLINEIADACIEHLTIEQSGRRLFEWLFVISPRGNNSIKELRDILVVKIKQKPNLERLDSYTKKLETSHHLTTLEESEEYAHATQ
jgi:hypothetical protein